jgi:SAM-dependent methyltransferase
MRWPSKSSDQLRCERCSTTQVLVDGVLDLLPDAARPVSFIARLMERASIARIYETHLWRRSIWVRALTGLSFEREYALIFEAAAIGGGSVVLDLGCGPGPYLRRFALALPHGLAVGLDRSRPMLREARRRAQREGLTNLLLVRADAGDLPFAPRQFDLVNCCGAFHLFPAVDEVLREVRRVLRPAGRLTVAAFRRRPTYLSARVAERRRRVTGVDAFLPSEFAARLARAGFGETRCLYERRAWFLMVAAGSWQGLPSADSGQALSRRTGSRTP